MSTWKRSLLRKPSVSWEQTLASVSRAYSASSQLLSSSSGDQQRSGKAREEGKQRYRQGRREHTERRQVRSVEGRKIRRTDKSG